MKVSEVSALPVRVETLHVGEFAMNCYLVENTDTHQVVIVDPGSDARRIIAAVGERKPAAVLLTHGHYDHIGAVDALCEHFGIPVYIHIADIPKLTDPVLNVASAFGYDVCVRTKPTPVADNQILTLAGMAITVLHTPGHSKGSVCYLLPHNAGLLCGDTLFNGGYGRYDFADGNFSELKNSLRRLLYMQPRVKAYPGHGGTTVAGRDEQTL
ncbi:MAG: MBL fold metallo-hydrolase [Eubacteriales bacterium]|nr:MBL fold metallo-hydrolase [Eubacteriales bacterium]